MSNDVPSPTLEARELLYLESLADRFPTIDSVVAEIAYLRGSLSLPRGTIHVLSDIHGDDRKLQHVLHNASGSLRPLVESLFKDRLSDTEVREVLTAIYYPTEAFSFAQERYEGEELHAYFQKIALRGFEVAVGAARGRSPREIERAFPDAFRDLFRELFFSRNADWEDRAEETMFRTLLDEGLAARFLRHLAFSIRRLTVCEVVVAGDCGDRGPRMDRVIKTIQRQPSVSVTWGNHDVTWMGACLGDPLLIATVLRISLRYRRLSQLEEGYGVIMTPLDKLARTCYADDAADHFVAKGTGLRAAEMMARMQKAISVIQFKLESQAIARNPEFDMSRRDLMANLDPREGVVRIDGQPFALLDTHFPTVDPSDPTALSGEEVECMNRIRQSFLHSDTLWEQMQYLERMGSMYLVRDDHLIFHGCIAVDADGEPLPMHIDGEDFRGRRMMKRLDRVMHRVFREPNQRDLDLLWYLWAGANSPLFGKDRMATFERYLIADKATHKEHKNPYFKLIHEPAFCQKLLAEFGVDPEKGMIVNGHVPVKIEDGENPLKRSGQAITIDGAFSEAYGDHGYTLVIRAGGTYLARHSHFESIEDAVEKGTDIIPEVTTIRSLESPRPTRDTEEGQRIAERITILEQLLAAYRSNQLQERRTR